MAKRGRKTNFRKILLFIVIAPICIVCVYLFYVGVTSIISLLPISTNEKVEKVIDPVEQETTLALLRAALRDKNIIMEKLIESSTSASIVGKLKDSTEVYFSKNKDAGYQVNSLTLILNKLTIENKKPTLIDLRFNRPIVKY